MAAQTLTIGAGLAEWTYTTAIEGCASSDVLSEADIALGA